MSKVLDFSYVNDNGKTVRGAAAFTHTVFTGYGGIQQYNDEVGNLYISEWIKQNSDIVNKELTHQAKKKRFKAL